MSSLTDTNPGDSVVEVVHIRTGAVAHREVVTDWEQRRVDELIVAWLIEMDQDEWRLDERYVEAS